MREHFLRTAVRLKDPTFVKGIDLLGTYISPNPNPRIPVS
jgi:hypothetical protein